VPRKLRVEYRTEESFRREYAQNIAKGGLFIPTRHKLEIREAVEVELSLSFRGESVVLPGEVVHCVPEEMAETGAQPGVAIQFLVAGEDLRAKLAAPAGALSNERVQGTGRRVAPRSRARVSAQLMLDGRTIEAHTRNLSSSGVLLVLQEKAPPIGRPVEVRIQHPTTDETIDVPGKVARHVDAAGATCIGVQFLVPEAREDEVADFVGRVRAMEHSRRLGGINGPIADLGIRAVLTMFGNTAPEGMLTLSRGAEEGYIAIQRRQLRAQLGSFVGREALQMMLEWTDGAFEFEAQIDDGLVAGEKIPVSELDADAPAGAAPPAPRRRPAAPPEARSKTRSEKGAGGLELMDLDDIDLGFDEDEGEYEDEDEAAWAGDDDLSPGAISSDSIALDTVSPNATLRVLSAGGDRSGLTKTEEAVLDLAAANTTVGQAVDIIPEPDAEVYAAVQSLLEQGFLILA